MKNKTIINDIAKYQTLVDTSKRAHALLATVKTKAIELATQGGNPAALLNAAQESQTTHREMATAEKKYKRTPRDRKEIAERIYQEAISYAQRTVELIGENYSGDTTYQGFLGPETWAWTIVTRGDSYSRKARKYFKNDAAHKLCLSFSDAVDLMNAPAAVDASFRDGLPLVSFRDDGSAAWLVKKNKRIEIQAGWMAWDGEHHYHSTRSLDHAQTMLAKKCAVLREREQMAREASIRYRKETRRERLIALLCDVRATIEDARQLGFCAPGIQQFQQQHNVGDTVDLKTLLKSGNPAAERLALHVARRIRRPEPAALSN
jgi:hypothetical protein